MRTSWLRAAAALLLCVAACSDNPTEPALAPVEIVVASGDGQFGALGQALPARLQVVVSTASTGKPKEDVGVLWEVVEGDATFAGSRATLTDESGSAFASIRLGGVPGDVVIKASVTEQESATVNFTLFAVVRPVLDALSIAEAPAGATITLDMLKMVRPASGLAPTLSQAVIGRRARHAIPADTLLSWDDLA